MIGNTMQLVKILSQTRTTSSQSSHTRPNVLKARAVGRWIDCIEPSHPISTYSLVYMIIHKGGGALFGRKGTSD